MEAPRAPHKEMTDPANRYILGTFNPKVLSCARRSILRSRDLEIPEKEEAVLTFLLSTAGLSGDARRDLRDALAPARNPITALPANHVSNPQAGVPHL